MLNGKIKFELPEPLAVPHLINNFFPDEMFERVKKNVNSIEMGPHGHLQYHTMLGRWESSINFDEDIEDFCLKKARRIFNDESLQKAYFFLARYQIVDGCIPHLWEHIDQNGTQTTIDIAIENTAGWSITVEGKDYYQSPNDAIVFAGQQHTHGRPAYPTNNPDLYTTVIFLHFTQPNHWFQNLGAPGISKYGKDGDIRFFNKYRYVAMPDRPINQPVCACHNYDEALELYSTLEEDENQEPEIVEIKIVSSKQLAPGIMSFEYSKESAKTLKGLSQNALYGLWQPASVSRENKSVTDTEIRNCFTYFMSDKHANCHPQDPITRLWLSLERGTEQAITAYSNRYSLNPVTSKQWQITRYEQNNMFKNHYDDSPLFPRTISVSFLLNDNFLGGELVFPEFDLTVIPKAGELIIFPSNFPYLHRVNPVTYGIRYSAVRWYTHYESFALRGV